MPNMEDILAILGDMQGFSPELSVSDELSEDDLMLVSAARYVPSYHDFLKKAEILRKNNP